MAEQIEPTREWDVRIAEAMGWRWWVLLVYPPPGSRQRIMLKPEARPHGGGWEGEWTGDPSVEPCAGYLREVPAFTTNPALVVPMLDRIVELTRAEVNLCRSAVGAWSMYLDDPTYLDRYFDGAFNAETPNLAVAAVLLAVWEEVSGV